MTKKKILVAGGGGFIGTHVVEQLLKRGYQVRIFDQLVFGKNILTDLEKNKNLEIIQGEIGDLYRLCLALKGVGDVIHLAGLVGDPACGVDKEFTIFMNEVSTRIIKELSKAFGVKKFIFTSSCSVYGASEKTVTETSKLNPVSLYAKTKIDSERELLADKDKNFHPIILRLATVFGHSRRPRFDLVANLFTAQAYNGGVIKVTGSNQWRPFIHASDVARAIVKAVEAPLRLVDRQIFNVGDDDLNSTIDDLAKLVAKIVEKTKEGQKVRVVIKDNKKDIRNYRVSFKKIRQGLGFKAKMGLEDGISEIYSNFKKGTYKRNYRDPMYINLEMTKLMQMDFRSRNYRIKNLPVLSLA